MNQLVYNEQLKLWRKRRVFIILILVALISGIFTYAQYRQHEEDVKKAGTTDWHIQVQERIIDLENRLGSGRLPDDYQAYFKVLKGQLQYYLDHDINPNAPGAPMFLKTFVENGISLLFPLFMMVIAADLISAEMSSGTIKFLLTRPVSRARILTSKYISLLLSISAIIVLSGLTAYLISGPVFGYGGWGAPVLTGFQVSGDTIDTSNVYQLPIYQLLIMEFGLAWFVSIIVGILTIFVSVIVRQTAAVMGIMLAALITGTILTNLVNAWPSAKYLFMVNLQLTNYLNGTAPPVSGMTLEFSMLVLFIWGLTSCVLSYFIFTKQDISS